MTNIALYNRASQNLPAFVRDDYETFTAFIACYHKWLELNQADIGLLTNIDTTLDSFISNFKKETNYLNITFPNIDERFLLAHIKQLYLSKGTEESYITLFKLLFNKEVIVKYPDQMTMKLSDGKWQQITSIFVEVVEGDIAIMNNHIATVTNAITSRAIDVTVEDIKIRRTGGGLSTIHLSSGGTGYTTPTVSLAGGNGAGATATAVVESGVISTITLVSGGAAYTTTGTSFTGGGTGAKAFAELYNGVVVGVTLISGGSGYTNPTITFTGGGVGAIANLTTADGVITSIIVNTPGDNYELPPTVTITGSNTTAAVVSSVQMLMMPNIYECNIDKQYYGSIEVGDKISFGTFVGKILPTINAFTIVDSGKEFRLGQTFDVDTVFGRGATVKVTKLTATDGIAELKFIKYGYGYVSDFESSNIIPPNISQSTPYQGFSATMFNRVGTFAASTLYLVNDLVFNTSDSTYYYCKLQYTSGSVPTLPPADGTHWALYLGTEETRVGNFVEFALPDPSGGYVLRETLSTTPPYDFTWVAAITKSTSSITWLLNVATVTTTTAHGFTSGDSVSLTGVTPTTYNGVHTITVTSPTTFTFSLVASSVATATVQGSVTTIYEVDKVVKSGNNFYKVTTAGQTGATAPTHTSGTVTQGDCAFLFLDSSELFALDYAGEVAREFYSSNKYKGDPNNGARIAFKLGAVCKYPGSYINSDGMASDIIRIHDGFLYQKYSYIVQVDKQLEEYKDIVKTFVHPAGTALFGEYNMSNKFSVKLKLTTLLSALSIWHADAVSAVHDDDLDTWFEKLLAVSDDSYVIYGTSASNDHTNIEDIDSPTFAQNWMRDTTKDVGDDAATASNVDAENKFTFAAEKSDQSNLNQLSKITQSLTWLANVVTVTTTTNHGLLTGDSVMILNVVPAAYNGSYNITVTGATTFTYPLVVTNPGTATAQGIVTVERMYFTKLQTIYNPADLDISTQSDEYNSATIREVSDASYMLDGQAYFDAYKDWTALPTVEAAPGTTGTDYWMRTMLTDAGAEVATAAQVDGTDNSYVIGTQYGEFVGKNMFTDSIDMSSAAWIKQQMTVVGDLVTCTGVTDPFVIQTINSGAVVGGRTFTISADMWIDAGQPTSGYFFYIYDGSVAYVYTSPITLTTTRTRYSFTATINALATSTQLAGRIDINIGAVIGNTYHAANLQLEENPTATAYAQYPVTESPAFNTSFLLGTITATGTAQAGAMKTITLATNAITIADMYATCRLELISGPGTGQLRNITASRMNLLTYSQQFDNVAWPTYGWTILANDTTAPDGTLTADRLTATAIPAALCREIIATTTSYTYSIYLKAGTWTPHILLRNNTTATNLASMLLVNGIPVGNGWYRCVVSSSTGISVGDRIGLYFGATAQVPDTQYHWAWGGQLETEIVASDYIHTIANAAVGVTLDTALTPVSRTNLITYSEQFDQWSPNGLIVTVDAMLSPTGTMTAETSAGAGTKYNLLSNLLLDTKYTYSHYVKPADPTKSLRLYCDGAIGVGTMNITPSTNTVTGYSGVYLVGSGNATSVGSGWYRVQMTVNTTGAGIGAFHIYPTNADLHGWWGAQLEVGTIASPYIPTVASPVTVVYNTIADATTNYIIQNTSAVSATGTAQAAAASSLTLSNASANALDSAFAFNRVSITSGPGVGQIRTALTSRKNLLKYSQSFDNASWVKQIGNSVVLNTFIAPDGTLTADNLVRTVAPEDYQNFTCVQGVTYTFSCYMAATTVMTGQVKLGRTSANPQVTTSLVLTSSWQRLSVTWTADITSTGFANISTTTVGNIYVWGAQLEIGTAPTEYIRTEANAAVGVAVTPAWSAEYLLINGSQGDFVDTPHAAAMDITGNWELESTFVLAASQTGWPCILTHAWSGGVLPYVLYIAGQTAVGGFYSAGWYTVTSAALTIGQKYTVIIKHIGTTLEMWVNGVLVNTNAAVLAATPVTTLALRIGRRWDLSSTEYFNGKIYTAIVRDHTATEIIRFDASQRSVGNGAYTSSTGNIWTMYQASSTPCLYAPFPDATSTYLIEDRDIYDITDLNALGDAGINGVSAISLVKDGQTIVSDAATVEDRDINSSNIFSIASEYTIDELVLYNGDSGTVTLNPYVDPAYVTQDYVSGPNSRFDMVLVGPVDSTVYLDGSWVSTGAITVDSVALGDGKVVVNDGIWTLN